MVDYEMKANENLFIEECPKYVFLAITVERYSYRLLG